MKNYISTAMGIASGRLHALLMALIFCMAIEYATGLIVAGKL